MSKRKNRYKQKKSKTVAKRNNKKSQATLIKYPKAAIVHRKDSLGRNYYINKNTGHRRSESDYKRDQSRVRNQREQYNQHIKDTLDNYQDISPFPQGVNETGIPQKQKTISQQEFEEIEGESFEVDDFEPIPIEGEDETG